MRCVYFNLIPTMDLLDVVSKVMELSQVEA